MATIETIKQTDSIDIKWPRHLLLDVLCFTPRVRGRVEQYLKNHRLEELSWRELRNMIPGFLAIGEDSRVDFVMSVGGGDYQDPAPVGQSVHQHEQLGNNIP